MNIFQIINRYFETYSPTNIYCFAFCIDSAAALTDKSKEVCDITVKIVPPILFIHDT